MRKPTKQDAKEYYEEHIDRYDEARDEAFNDEFKTMFIVEFHSDEKITKDDIQGFLDSFTFPEEGEWLAREYESYIGDLEDQAYSQYKDELMENK